jgi:hypothetical protein
MIRTVNGKSVNIPDKEIESYMKNLDLTKEQAIEMWLDDEGYTDNEEQLELEKKAKESGIMRDIHGASATDKAKKTTPKTVKVSEEKRDLFDLLYDTLRDYSVDFDYFHMFDVEGEPLDVKDFTDILSKLEFVREDTVKCYDGKEYLNNGDIVVDMYGNLFKIDYYKLSFNFLGELDFLEEIYI